MQNTLKMLRKEELKVGMQVSSEQLSDIYYTYIILGNSNISDDGNKILGTIVWFGDTLNTDSNKFLHDSNIACIYNSEDTDNGDVYYEF